MYASILGISYSLHQDVFEQPVRLVFFSNLLVTTNREASEENGFDDNSDDGEE